MKLDLFSKEIGAVIARTPLDRVPAAVADLLPDLLYEDGLLKPEQKTAPEGTYGRHTLYLSPDNAFSVIAAVWPAGFTSPIHDHMTWCAFGVLEGTIRETRFEAIGKDTAKAVSAVDLTPGDAGHLPVGGGDIHSMHNPTDRPAISIHVYGGNSDELGPNVVTVYREIQRERAAALA